MEKELVKEVSGDREPAGVAAADLRAAVAAAVAAQVEALRTTNPLTPHACRHFAQTFAVLAELRRMEAQPRQQRITVRELFYRKLTHFRTQAELAAVLSQICALSGLSRAELGLRASHKGLAYGPVTLEEPASGSAAPAAPALLDLAAAPSGRLISDAWAAARIAATAATCVLVVEKDATFSLLAEAAARGTWRRDVLLVTGRGYPDLATKAFVQRLGWVGAEGALLPETAAAAGAAPEPTASAAGSGAAAGRQPPVPNPIGPAAADPGLSAAGISTKSLAAAVVGTRAIASEASAAGERAGAAAPGEGVENGSPQSAATAAQRSPDFEKAEAETTAEETGAGVASSAETGAAKTNFLGAIFAKPGIAETSSAETSATEASFVEKNATVETAGAAAHAAVDSAVSAVSPSGALPAFYLGDCDPHGLCIYLNYVEASRTAQARRGLAAPHLRHLGVSAADAGRVPAAARLPLTRLDRAVAAGVAARGGAPGATPAARRAAREAKAILAAGFKCEIEAFDSIRPDYLVEVFLAEKLPPPQQSNICKRGGQD